eukprot:182708_1
MNCFVTQFIPEQRRLKPQDAGLNPVEVVINIMITSFSLARDLSFYQLMSICILIWIALYWYGKQGKVNETQLIAPSRKHWKAMNDIDRNTITLILQFSSFRDLLLSHRVINTSFHKVSDYTRNSKAILRIWINAMLHSVDTDSWIFDYNLYNIYINKHSPSIQYLMLFEYFALFNPGNSKAITKKFCTHWKYQRHYHNLWDFVNNDNNTKYVIESIRMMDRLYSEISRGEFMSIRRMMQCAIQYGALYGALWIMEFVMNVWIANGYIDSGMSYKCKSILEELCVCISSSDVYWDESSACSDLSWSGDQIIHTVMKIAFSRLGIHDTDAHIRAVFDEDDIRCWGVAHFTPDELKEFKKIGVASMLSARI